MSRREPVSLKSLLPRVLARVAGDGGPIGAIAPLWEEVVGTSIARQARPLKLHEGFLLIGVTSAVWARELSGREAELLRMLREKLPSLRLEGLRFVPV